MKDIVLYRTTKGEFFTLEEWFKAQQKEKKVYYTDNRAQQITAVEMYEAQGISVAEFCHPIDLAFSQMVEMSGSSVRFVCVTAELPESLKTGQNVDDAEVKTISELFVGALPEHSLQIRVEYLDEASVPCLLSVPEYARRLEQMQRLYGDKTPGISKEYILTVNRSHPLVSKLMLWAGVEAKKEEAFTICRHLFDLGLMELGELDEKEKKEFVQRSYRFLQMIG